MGQPMDWRTLRTVCAGMMASVVLQALVLWLVVRARAEPTPGLPPGLPLSLTMLAIVLLVLASRLRSGLLRRAAVAQRLTPRGPEAAFAAYRLATLVSFALLEAAGMLGLVLALLTASVRSGLILCAASLISMLVRLPREAELARLSGGLPGAPPSAASPTEPV